MTLGYDRGLKNKHSISNMYIRKRVLIETYSLKKSDSTNEATGHAGWLLTRLLLFLLKQNKVE